MQTLQDLELLVNSRYPIVAIETVEEERVEGILSRLAARLGISFMVWTATDGLHLAGATGGIFNTQEAVAALTHLGTTVGEGLFYLKDLSGYLTDPKVVRKLKDIARLFTKDRRAILFSAPRVDLPADLVSLVALLRLDLPGEAELTLLARNTLRDLSQGHRINMELTEGDFRQLVASLRGLTLFEAERALTRAVLQDLALTRQDLETILEIKREIIEKDGILDFYPRQTTLADVGGMEKLKAWLARRRRAFTPEAAQFGLDPPKGILLLGVQGCGKSLCAKAVAREWELALLKMEPGRLYDKFVGESEKNLERALGVAARMAPVVLWIDEIEKGFASVSSSEADAGLSKRIFGRLLAWLQDRPAPVFVAATSNDIASLPPEMMRKGRFDEIFFVDLPNPQERAAIFTIHLKKRKRDPAAFDLAALVAASDGFSGAEIEQAIVAALYAAFSAGGELTTAHIQEEIRATRPLSVVRAEDIEALREWAKDRAVMVS